MPISAPMQSSIHPIHSGEPFALISGEEPRYVPEIQGGHKGLEQALAQSGIKYEAVDGNYGNGKAHAPAFVAYGLGRDQAMDLGRKMGQESVIYSRGGQHEFIFTNGPNAGKFHPADQQGMQVFPSAPDEGLATNVRGLGHVRFNFDHGKLLDVPHKGRAMSEETQKSEVSVTELKQKLANVLRGKIEELSKAMEEFATREVSSNTDASVGDLKKSHTVLTLQSSNEMWMEELAKATPTMNRIRQNAAQQIPETPKGQDQFNRLNSYHTRENLPPDVKGMLANSKAAKQKTDLGEGWTHNTHHLHGTPHFIHQSGLSVFGDPRGGWEAYAPDADDVTQHYNLGEVEQKYGVKFPAHPMVEAGRQAHDYSEEGPEPQDAQLDEGLHDPQQYEKSELTLQSSDKLWMEELAKAQMCKACKSEFCKGCDGVAKNVGEGPRSNSPTQRRHQNLKDRKAIERLGTKEDLKNFDDANRKLAERKAAHKSEDFIDLKNSGARPTTTDAAKKGGPRLKNVGSETPEPAKPSKEVPGKLDEGSGGQIEKGKGLKKGFDAAGAPAPVAPTMQASEMAKTGPAMAKPPTANPTPSAVPTKPKLPKTKKAEMTKAALPPAAMAAARDASFQATRASTMAPASKPHGTGLDPSTTNPHHGPSGLELDMPGPAKPAVPKAPNVGPAPGTFKPAKVPGQG